jgi:hypothetical protein
MNTQINNFLPGQSEEMYSGFQKPNGKTYMQRAVDAYLSLH